MALGKRIILAIFQVDGKWFNLRAVLKIFWRNSNTMGGELLSALAVMPSKPGLFFGLALRISSDISLISMGGKESVGGVLKKLALDSTTCSMWSEMLGSGGFGEHCFSSESANSSALSGGEKWRPFLPVSG